MPCWYELRDKKTNEYVPYERHLNLDDYNTVECYAEKYPEDSCFSRDGFYRGAHYQYGNSGETTWRIVMNGKEIPQENEKECAPKAMLNDC